jgi:hypothetical protein
MTSFFEGQRLVLRNRPDTVYYKEQEAEQLQAVQQLMPKYHVRPSALLRTARTAALAAGALAAVAPKSVSLAVTGGQAACRVYREPCSRAWLLASSCMCALACAPAAQRHCHFRRKP